MASVLDSSQSSIECAKSELDLFGVPHTQTSIVDGSWDTIYPYPDFETGATIRFDITGTNNHYISLADTELHMTLVIKKADNTRIGDNDAVSIANNTLHSMFEQVQVHLNNVNVENSNRSYHYRAYVENLLCYSKEAKDTLLNREGWVKDTAGSMDTMVLTAGTDGLLNSGFVSRRNLIKGNKKLQLAGKLHCDIFNTNKYLLNNVDVRVTLVKSDEKFVLMGPVATCSTFNIHVESCFLKIRRVAISPAVMLAHAMALEKATAKYPIKRVITKYIAIPKVSRTEITAIHTGIMPTRVVCWFVSNAAHAGTYTANPFNFLNMNITEIGLRVANKPAPYSTALKIDFDNNCYAEGYLSLFKNIREAPMDISYNEYKSGYTVFAFDLTPDLCSSEHYSLLKDGSLDLSLSMSAAPETDNFVYIYMEFDNIIEITKERNIIFDYKI